MYQPIVGLMLGGLSRIMLAFVMGACCGMMFSCQTVEGFGEDVETAGDAIEDTARDAAY